MRGKGTVNLITLSAGWGAVGLHARALPVFATPLWAEWRPGYQSIEGGAGFNRLSKPEARRIEAKVGLGLSMGLGLHFADDTWYEPVEAPPVKPKEEVTAEEVAEAEGERAGARVSASVSAGGRAEAGPRRVSRLKSLSRFRPIGFP